MNFKCPAAKLLVPLRTACETAIPQICSRLGLPASPADQYKKGELPCGKIVDGNWKQVHIYKLPKIKESENGIKIKVDSFDIPIYLSRQQRQGRYVEADLDGQKPVQKLSSLEFMKDVSVRYVPYEDKSYFQVCFNIPGADISTPKVKFKGKAKKKIGHFGHIHADAKMEGKFGDAKFDYARSCVTAFIKLDEKTLKPVIEIKEIQKPVFSNVDLGEVKIKFKSWLAKLTNKILKVFSVNLEEIISKVADDKIEKFEKKEVESGKWVLRVLKGKVHTNLSTVLTEKISQQVYDKGDVLTFSSLNNKLRKQCEKISSLVPASSQAQDFFANCDDFFSRVKLQFAPFHRSDDMEAMKCYDYLAPLYGTKDAQGKKKWWAKDCQFSMQVYAQFPGDLEKYKDSLIALLMTFRDSDEWPTSVSGVLNKLNIDDQELDHYLDLWRERSTAKPHLEDLVDLIERETGRTVDLEDLKATFESVKDFVN